MRFKREVLCKLESAPPRKLHEHRWFLEERKGQGNFEDGGQILVILLSNPCSPCRLQAPGWDLYWAGTLVLNKRLAGMIWVGEGEGGINSPCGFAALRAWHLSAVCGPLGACQTRHPWNHRATRKAGWGGASGNVLILSIARCHHAHTHGRQWGSRGGEGKVDGFMWVKLQVLPDGSHAWGWPWAKLCGRKVCFHSCHSLHFIIFSIPAPSHPQIHPHIPPCHLSHDVSHSPSGSPPACPPGKPSPEPYLAPWPMALHLPPTSLCSTIRLSHTCWYNFILSHINTSLNSTLYYHVPSPDVPPSEKAVFMKLETLSDPLCNLFRAQWCWDHTRCFMNIQECAELFTSSLHLLYGQPQSLKCSWELSGVRRT